MIKVSCISGSIPETFDEQLEEFSKQGFRVLGVSYKKLNKNIMGKNLSDEEYEADMVFVGFLLFENPMKKST